jgi:hypothetical protein
MLAWRLGHQITTIGCFQDVRYLSQLSQKDNILM